MIKPRETCGPKTARREHSLLRPIAIVIGEDETGEQQEEADRDVTAVHDWAQWSKGMGVGKMEKDQIESSKATDARECRQLRVPRRSGGLLDKYRASRSLWGRGRHCGDRTCW